MVPSLEDLLLSRTLNYNRVYFRVYFRDIFWGSILEGLFLRLCFWGGGVFGVFILGEEGEIYF
jgi:hypothetical protein